MSRYVAALCLVCLALLAGCGGMGGDATASPTPTSTPAPVPSDTPTPDAGAAAVPGLSEDGVENAFALGRAHRAVLANVSFTVRLNETTRFANGSRRLDTTTVSRVTPMNDTTRYYRVTTYEGPVEPVFYPYPSASRVETYAADRVHSQFRFPNGTTTVTSFDRRFSGQRQTLEQVLAAFNTTIEDRTACGDRTCYGVRSTELTAPWGLSDALVLPDAWTVTNASLFALVESNGVVREYRVRYTVETENATYTAVRRVRYTALGDTAVERPEWVTGDTS